ncbi:hypothetical protein GCM10010294_34980 [Streptomyces griseoloalbus]|nr:hypothetical protein GCM10010294_34980 [Streptomyces griseoloalbus]
MFLVCCTGGCSTPSGAGNAEPGTGSTRPSLAPLPPPEPGISLPLDSYVPSPEEQGRSDRAQAALERACLARFGLRWEGPGRTALETGRRMALSRQAARFGVTDPEHAERYGYHAPPWSTYDPRVGELLDQHQHVTPDVRKVLYGTATEAGGRPVPRNGCRAEAARRLARGAPPADRNLPGRLAEQAAAAALEDPRLSAVVGAWRSCVTGAGLRYASPQDAAGDPRWKRDRTPTEEEVSVAVADVRCQNEVRYLPTLVTVTAGKQRELISRHALELGRLERLKDVRAENVAEALAAQPSGPEPAQEGEGHGSG